jgi:beta-lactamase class C
VPKVAWGIALVLIALIAIELAVIARHYVAEAPAKQGEHTANTAERGLGSGPLSAKAYRINYGHLDARVRALMERRDMVGLGVAVIEDGQLSFIKGYGETVAGSGQRVTAQTQFRWASLSKGVGSTLVARLAAMGKLSLDDPVSKWSATLKLPHDNQNVATLADALSHRLGIVKNAYDDRLEGNVDPGQIRASFGPLFPMCPPGTCFAYQNIAYDVAHEAVEKATGMSYDQAAHALLFGPLGMTSASTTRDGYVGKKSFAPPHDGRRELAVQEAYFRIPAAGGVSSSIVDLGIWTRAQMGGAPQVLPPGLLFELHVPRVLTPTHGRADYDRILQSSAYGLGFRSSIYEGHHLVWHRGAVKGSRSLLIFDPVEKFGVALLWNSTTVKPTALPMELFDEYYRRPFHDWLQLGRD